MELIGLISTAVSDTFVGRKVAEFVVLFLLLGGVSKRILFWEPASRGKGGAGGDESIVFSSAAPGYSPEEASLGGGDSGGARGLARGVVTKTRGKAVAVNSLMRRSYCSSSSSSSAMV